MTVYAIHSQILAKLDENRRLADSSLRSERARMVADQRYGPRDTAVLVKLFDVAEVWSASDAALRVAVEAFVSILDEGERFRNNAVMDWDAVQDYARDALARIQQLLAGKGDGCD